MPLLLLVALPSLASDDFLSSLIDSATHGDRSAIQFLEDQYGRSNPDERIRIAEVLLHRVDDDRAIWTELETQARIAIEHPNAHDDLAWEALMAAASDMRSRPLLERALASDDRMLVFAAIYGYGTQKDEAALGAIEKSIARFPDNEWDLVMALKAFGTESADALALKLLEDDAKKAYFAPSF